MNNVGITLKPPPRSLRGRDHFEMKSAHDFSLFESEARMEEREKNCRSETELFQRNHHQTLSFDHHQQKQKTNSSDVVDKIDTWIQILHSLQLACVSITS